MRATQKGFTALEGLIALLILVIIIVGGYYVWHNQKNTQAKSSTSTSKNITTSSPSSQSSSQKYLTISEWGVKMPIGNDASDANYVIKNGYVYLSLKSLDGTVCAASESSIGALTRFTKDATYQEVTGFIYDQNNPNQTYLSVDPTATHVGNYYFTYQRGNSVCLNGDLPTAVKANTEFKSDYIGIIAI